MTESGLDIALRAASLARIRLTADEGRSLGPDLERILEAFGELSRLQGEDRPGDELQDETGDPAPVASTDPAHGVPEAGAGAREDRPRDGGGSRGLLDLAPEPLEGFFGVPKTIGSQE